MFSDWSWKIQWTVCQFLLECTPDLSVLVSRLWRLENVHGHKKRLNTNWKRQKTFSHFSVCTCRTWSYMILKSIIYEHRRGSIVSTGWPAVELLHKMKASRAKTPFVLYPVIKKDSLGTVPLLFGNPHTHQINTPFLQLPSGCPLFGPFSNGDYRFCYQHVLSAQTSRTTNIQ